MKQWIYELNDGSKGFTFGRRKHTRDQAVAFLAWAHPGSELVSCEPYQPAPECVWDGRNAYRDANPDWWRQLYGGKQTA